mmetsp:Transcript_22194/g.32842  ORF Transcript_22194/g.32842 Transcript_22194/m.32842 type:complete len:139 (-) Transcript_22194:397-813(-)
MIKTPIELISMNTSVDIMDEPTFPLGDQQQKEAIVNEMNIMNKGGLETTKDQGLEDVDMNATIVLTTSNDSGDTFKDSKFNDEESGIAEVNEEREEMVTLGAWTRFFLYLLLLIHIAFIVLTIYDTITTFAPGRDEAP